MHLPMPFAHQRWRQDTFCNEELLSSLWIFCAFSMQQHQVVSEGSLKFIARLYSLTKQASKRCLPSPRTSQLYVVHLRRAETWVVRARKRFCSCASQGARARMHVCKGHPRKGLHQSCKSCAHFHLMHKDRLLMIHS